MHKKTLGSLLVVLGASGTCAGTSSARSTPAMLGNTLSHQVHCMGISFNTGAATNVCPNFKASLTVGLPLDSNGAHTVTITIRDANTLNTIHSFCRIRASRKDAAGSTATNFLFPATFDAFEDLTGTVTVPANGLMWVECALNPNATISRIQHTPH